MFFSGLFFQRRLVEVQLCLECILCLVILPTITPLGFLLPLCSFFYWCIYRNELISLPSIIFLSLFCDALSGMPFGFYAFFYGGIYMITLHVHGGMHDYSFKPVWILFIAITGSLSVLVVLYYMLLLKQNFAFPLTVAWLFCICCYPFITRLTLSYHVRITQVS